MMAARMQRELVQLTSAPPPGVAAWPTDGASLQRLTAQLDGPRGSPYEGGVFVLEVRIPDRYPIEPPQMRFVTPVYHPNIDAGGRICLSVLKTGDKGDWKPALNVATVLQSIGLLLSEPNPDDSLMADIASEYKHQRGVFDEKARRCTQQHACGTLAAQAGGESGAAAAGGAEEAAGAGAEPAAAPKRAAEDEAGSDAPAAEAKPAEGDVPPQRKRLQLSRPAAAPQPPADGLVLLRRGMSAPAGGAARAAYRTLMRAVSRHVTSVSGNGMFRDALRAEFRAGAAQRDPAAAAAAVARAQDAAFYVNAVNEHKNLLLSYGISIDKEAETKDRVKHTAARVGLAVPEFDQHGAPIGMPKRTK